MSILHFLHFLVILLLSFIFYTIPITVGNKQQAFEVQVDTTTSETWLPSINSTYEVDKFDPKSSSTCELSKLSFEIDDEDGNVRGPSFYDSLTVGPFSLKRFGMVLVDSFQSGFKDAKQGKLGLGFRHEHGVDFNWLGSLKQNGLIPTLTEEGKNVLIDYESHHKVSIKKSKSKDKLTIIKITNL